MRVLWLADVLRAEGLTVVEHSGWTGRGFQPWEPRYGIVHATAAPRSQSDADQVRIVRDGHAGLQGPIANCCVDRTGRWHVLASGRCNTAKTGWAGPADDLGNTYLLGVEACNDNGLAQPPEAWPSVQYQAYVRGWAAICRRMGWAASRCVGHKEHQPGDKSDPTFNMTTFRAAVAQAIEGDDMGYLDWSAADRKALITDLREGLGSTVQEGYHAATSGAFDVGYEVDPRTALRQGWVYGKLNLANTKDIPHDVWNRVNPQTGETYGAMFRGALARLDALAIALEAIVPGVIAGVEAATAEVAASDVAELLEVRVRQDVAALTAAEQADGGQ